MFVCVCTFKISNTSHKSVAISFPLKYIFASVPVHCHLYITVKERERGGGGDDRYIGWVVGVYFCFDYFSILSFNFNILPSMHNYISPLWNIVQFFAG